MSYETTAGKLGCDQAEAEVEYDNPNTNRRRRGIISSVAHHVNPGGFAGLNNPDRTPYPVTVAVQLVGEPRVDYLPPSCVIRVGGDRPEGA